ncbi:hypothetical protein M0R01_00005, partial [bacterium]|nr:hypothetical protein [bacterium]
MNYPKTLKILLLVFFFATFSVNFAFALNCGTSHTKTFLTPPTTGLCSYGTASIMYGTVNGPWAWYCTYGNQSDLCYAVKGGTNSCGSANGTSTILVPTSNLCSDGSTPKPVISGNGWVWTCGSA